MSFKYINPGYGKLFYCYEDYPAYERYGSLYNPKFGVAVYSSNCRILLANTAFSTLCLKFDVFLPESTTGILNIGLRGAFLQISQTGTSTQITALGSEDMTVTGAYTNLKLGSVNTIIIFIAAEPEEPWWAQVTVNGEIIISGSNEEVVGIFPANMQLPFAIPYEMPVSNLIVSDSVILPNEIIAQVDAFDVDTTMTARGDGSFSGVEAGSYVLQVLNPTSLYGIFGAGGKVTGMAAIAAPAYNTGDDSLFLQCRKVDGDNVTDYSLYSGTDDEYVYYAHELENIDSADESDCLPAIGEQIAVSPDTTFADLNGLKLGWVIVEE